MAVVKVTSKGQVTIPIEARKRLGITDNTYLDVAVEGDTLRFRKRSSIKPLSEDDPIWEFIGQGTPKTKASDVSIRHDHYLAEGEIRGWRSR
jgi:transcriptional pleiotropic regulator of transition state genes